MRKLGVEEWLVLSVMSMYTGAKTVVRTVYGNSNGFEVMVSMHQGTAVLDARTQNGDEPVGEYSFLGQSCLSSADSC